MKLEGEDAMSRSASCRPICRAGLGLVLAVGLVIGGCPLPEQTVPEETDVLASSGAPSIEVITPSSDLTVTAGDLVQIRWVDSDPDDNAQVTVFYDSDNDATNGFTAITQVDEDPDGASDIHDWDTTGVTPGTYYVGAEIDDGTDQAVAYAPGQVTIESAVAPPPPPPPPVQPQTARQFDLDNIGLDFPGSVLEGFSFYGFLGTYMAGRFDITGPDGTPDGISDFIVVAPSADSHYVERPNVGEAYLILGWDEAAGTRDSSWYDGGRFSVNTVGTGPIPGTIIVGPDYRTDTEGIGRILPVEDVEGDGGAELIFGIPHIVDGRFEDQDYDPCDLLDLIYGNAPSASPNPSTPIPTEDDVENGGPPLVIRETGYFVVLASNNPIYSAATGLGGVIHLDDVAMEHTHERHPRTVMPANGFRRYQHPVLGAAADFHNNDYRFAETLGAEDIDGNGSLEWIVSASETFGGLGRIEIWHPVDAILWTAGTPPGDSDVFSEPWMVPVVSGGQCVDRALYWSGTLDLLDGDPEHAATGGLQNPTGVGDFNGDGPGDLASAAPLASPSPSGAPLSEAGVVYLVFGRAPFGNHNLREIKDPLVSRALPGIMVFGTGVGDHLGAAMAAMGVPNRAMPGQPVNEDFNADGRPDWVVAAPGRDVGGLADVGAIAIIFGNDRVDGRFTWDQIGTADLPGVVITGESAGDGFGTYMACAGDINGDGSDDLLVAAPGADNPFTGEQDTGAVYVLFGPPATGAVRDFYTGLSGSVGLADLVANNEPIRVHVYYGTVPGHRLGPVAGAGDVDNDGYEDILIADPLAGPVGRTEAGRVYLIYGSPEE